MIPSWYLKALRADPQVFQMIEHAVVGADVEGRRADGRSELGDGARAARAQLQRAVDVGPPFEGKRAGSTLDVRM